MKNLLHQTNDLEKLEDLPSRSRIPLGGGHWGRYRGRDYPYKKVYRFLESRKGVKWDDVFSEFVHLTWIKDEDKTREKIAYNVVFDTLMKDGKVHFLEKGSGNVKPIDEYWRRNGIFYVHPVTKCLAYAESIKKESEKKPETERKLGKNHILRKVGGVWFEYKWEVDDSYIVTIDGLFYRKVKTLPPSRQMAPAIYPPFPQKFFGQKVIEDSPKYKKTDDGFYLIPVPRFYESPRENRTIVNRQLSSKELKKYGLKNDVKPLNPVRCTVCGNVNCTNAHDIRCNICGERWCKKHAVYPYGCAVGFGNPKV